MIKPLPYWVVPDSFPAFYETEGATAIQQTAKIYGKIQELINDYNTFVTQINNSINEFEESTNKNYEEFKECIIKTMNDYIETIDLKINLQDDKITDAINYMKDNIIATTTDIINQAITDGDLQVSVSYDPETESLTILTSGGV